MKKKIEILAPAKDLLHGIAAINAGADAVYIGAPQFGQLCAYSEPFGICAFIFLLKIRTSF